MKKIISLVLFLTVSMGMYAQKSYVTIYGSLGESYGVYLSGAVPSSMKLKYTADDFPELHLSSSNSSVCNWIGAVLNLLAKEGFTVEQMNTFSTNTTTSNNVWGINFVNYLLSKTSSDDSNTNGARMIRVEDDSDVYEVARYNLQGMPINESEKGIQIIVYSNFTTKTIIKE